METSTSKKIRIRCRYNAEQRAKILSGHGASGERVTDYCNRIGLSSSAFYRWRRQALKSDEVAENVSWSELAIPECSGKVEIHLPNEVCLIVHGTYDFHAIVEALVSC